MGRVNTPLLDEKAKMELEKRFRTDKSHAVRMRCQLILLKADGRKRKKLQALLKCVK
jgi:hypothetical protein